MVAGYEPGESPPAERLGPMPPRIAQGGYPGSSSGGYPTTPTPMPRPPSAPGTTGALPPVGPASYPPPAGYPGPGSPPPTGTLPKPFPSGAPAYPGTPAAIYSGPPAFSAPPAVAAPAGRRSVGTLVLAALVVVLVLVVAGQGVFLMRMDDRLARAEARGSADRTAADSRLDGLETRTKDLEQRVGKNLDAAAVASAVTPSVFLLDAGASLGTAFAFGPQPAAGGTDLVTNYHVIADVYEGGGRDVALQRDNKRFPAKIVRVDARRDLAIVHVEEQFTRLQPASEAAKPGEPVVVIGAPLGLENTVTSGVVSAVRDTDEGELIQFDAPINGGNSGGPVVNAQQLVVGVATAKAREAEGIGAAIPVAVVCRTFTLC